MTHKIRVGITHGDMNGIGYETILKAFSQPPLFELCTPIVYGSAKAAQVHRDQLGLETTWKVVASAETAQEGQLNLVDVTDSAEVSVEFGQPSAEAGRWAHQALERAAEDVNAGRIDVVVTCPINKASIQSEAFQFPGHTEFFEARCGGKALMILMNELMRVALVTVHVPLKEVSSLITIDRVEERVHQLLESLKRDFNCSAPRLAVLSLNPHNGDNGLLGKEEQEVLQPLIAKLQMEGLPVFGSYSPDGFFGAGNYRHFDAILAMYHDQGLAPFKALSMDEGVNFSAGLNIVRTSPDHGTAFDIAGKGMASEQSLLQAIYAAIDIYRHRQTYDEVNANPLPFAPRNYREDRKPRQGQAQNN